MSNSQTLFEDFGDLVEDTLLALVNDPDSVSIGVHQNPTCEGELIVDIVAPRAMLAMIVGKGGDTAKALHRIFLCQARNWGLATSMRLSWDPSDA